jgi:hypothetical protein
MATEEKRVGFDRPMVLLIAHQNMPLLRWYRVEMLLQSCCLLALKKSMPMEREIKISDIFVDGKATFRDQNKSG